MSGGGDVHAAMILCAGLGTRLRPLTEERAKPMVPVGDRPALAHVVERVRLAVPARIVVNVHHRPEDVRAWAEPEGIAVSHERELLGTAGGVTRASVLLGSGDVLVWNGDILSELDPRHLVAAHASAKTEADGVARATLAVHARAAGQGNVGFGADGRIVRLRAESVGSDARAETRGGDFLGIHVVGAALRALLPERGCLIGDVYLPALRRGEHLQAFVTEAPFVDVGSIAQYLAANAQWLRSRGLTSWAHPTATVNGAIDGSVVGAGAVVDAAVLASVVWPGAHVQSACNEAVVTPLTVASAR
jgi:mannose-1-phosphate guanylyltransferase